MSIAEPAKIITPWADTGSKNPIPQNANNTTGEAGYDKGFPDITMTPPEAGGIPPAGQDVNGILFEVTSIVRYVQAGGQASFSSALATAIGGYPSGALVLGSDGVTIWQSQVASNMDNPDVTPTNWKKIDAGLRGDLLGDMGPSNIGFRPTLLSGAVHKALTESIYNQIIDVTWFAPQGFLPDWNAQTQTGNDYTSAVQAAINAYALLGTKRQGGKRAIKFPIGHYKLTSVTIPRSMGFGIDLIGAGRHATVIWSDPSDTNPTINSEIEFVNFRGMSCFGALSETSNSANRKPVFYKGKLASNLADIDVRFSDCIVGYAGSFVQAYGRGVVFDQGTTAVYCTNLLEIVASPDTIFTGGVNDTVFAGMRHYTFLGIRADVVSRLVKITGTAAQKDHIHSIQFVGCDLAACDRLIDGPDATIRGTVLCGNESLDSFAGGVVTVKSVASAMDVSNNWVNKQSYETVPSSAADCIKWVWNATGVLNGLTMMGTTAKGLSYGVATCQGSGVNVKIIGCHFPNFCDFSAGNTNHWVFFSPVNCDGLAISNNSFSGVNISGVYQLFDATVQTSPRTRTGNNIAPWSWSDMRLRYSPNLLVNGTISATAPASLQGRYWVDESYVNVEFLIGINPAEVAGDLSISLPSIPAIAENPSITPSYGGHGSLSRITGFSVAGAVVAPIQVNPSTQEAELWKEASMVRTRITAADKSGAISLFGSFRYRY